MGELRALAGSGQASAFGEIGLDYDRLNHCDAETQREYFGKQLDLAIDLGGNLPLFLHSRAAGEDFAAMLRARLDRLPKRGVVHSFTGTEAEMRGLVEMGFDIGVNGCSLKTEENLEVVRAVPLERLQLETDAPWCDMRPSHASSRYWKEAPALPRAVKKEKWEEGCMVKGRNEPCAIVRVAYAVAGVKGISVEEVAEAYVVLCFLLCLHVLSADPVTELGTTQYACSDSESHRPELLKHCHFQDIAFGFQPIVVV